MAAPAPIPAFAPVLREDFEEDSGSESAREVGVELMGAAREDPGAVDVVDIVLEDVVDPDVGLGSPVERVNADDTVGGAVNSIRSRNPHLFLMEVQVARAVVLPTLSSMQFEAVTRHI